MVQTYGYTDGCPTCQKLRNMSKGGQSLTGRLGVNHSIECKTRIMQKMENDHAKWSLEIGIHKYVFKSSDFRAARSAGSNVVGPILV